MINSSKIIRKLYTIILLLFLFSNLISCNDENDASEMEAITTPLEAVTFENVSYGDHSQQVYDIYLPAGRTNTKTKVMILVHGGGWTEGDKSDVNGYISLIQATHPEHAILNMNYVLADLNNKAFPNQFLDVQRVINKLKNESETLQILPEFGLIGVSAGAHISLMYDAIYDADNDVKFVTDIVGPSDFTDPFYANDPNIQLLINFLVDPTAYPPNANYLEELSPVLQISSASSPTLLFHGDQDPLVPVTNGETLKNALESNGIDHQFTIYNGGHGNWSPTDLLDVQKKINIYIDLYLPIEN